MDAQNGRAQNPCALCVFGYGKKLPSEFSATPAPAQKDVDDDTLPFDGFQALIVGMQGNHQQIDFGSKPFDKKALLSHCKHHEFLPLRQCSGSGTHHRFLCVEHAVEDVAECLEAPLHSIARG